jgi:hypothetical protein
MLRYDPILLSPKGEVIPDIGSGTVGSSPDTTVNRITKKYKGVPPRMNRHEQLDIAGANGDKAFG